MTTGGPELMRVTRASFTIRITEHEFEQVEQASRVFGGTFDQRKFWAEHLVQGQRQSPREFSYSVSIDEHKDWQGFYTALRALGINITQVGDPVGALIPSPYCVDAM